MFSATFPQQMEALARRILKKPIEMQIGGRSVVFNTAEQHMLVIEEEHKFIKPLELLELLELLEPLGLLGIYQPTGSPLIFVHKQGAADVLQHELMKRQYSSLTLHGGLDQVSKHKWWVWVLTQGVDFFMFFFMTCIHVLSVVRRTIVTATSLTSSKATSQF
jgi:ATP-dependent RNA helicase DDX46/PRP5